MISTNTNYLPKGPPPNTTTLRIRVSAYEFRGHRHSVCKRTPSSKFRTNSGPPHGFYSRSLWTGCITVAPSLRLLAVRGTSLQLPASSCRPFVYGACLVYSEKAALDIWLSLPQIVDQKVSSPLHRQGVYISLKMYVKLIMLFRPFCLTVSKSWDCPYEKQCGVSEGARTVGAQALGECCSCRFSLTCLG